MKTSHFHIGLILCLLFQYALLSAQDCRGGDFRFTYLTSSIDVEVEVNLYFKTTEEPGLDSIFITGDGFTYPTGVSEVVPVQRDISIYRYRRRIFFPGSANYSISFLNQEFLSADNLPNRQDTLGAVVFLSSYFSNELLARPPFDTSLAKWNDFAFDHYIDELGDLRLQLSGDDLDYEAEVGYLGSSSLALFHQIGAYSYPAPLEDLLIDPRTGEFWWRNPPGPGKYLLGFDLVGFRPGTEIINNRFNRLLIIELTEEDFLTNNKEEREVPASLSLYPNPTRTHCHVQLPPAARVGMLRVTDLHGRQVYQDQLTAIGSQQVTLPVGSWPAGVYVVSVEGANGRWVEKLVVE